MRAVFIQSRCSDTPLKWSRHVRTVKFSQSHKTCYSSPNTDPALLPIELVFFLIVTSSDCWFCVLRTITSPRLADVKTDIHLSMSSWLSAAKNSLEALGSSASILKQLKEKEVRKCSVFVEYAINRCHFWFRGIFTN